MELPICYYFQEIDIDAIARKGEVICMAISEHVENAGVHSGDASLITPPQDLNEETMAKITEICRKIARGLKVSGPFNIQLIAKVRIYNLICCHLLLTRKFLMECFITSC